MNGKLSHSSLTCHKDKAMLFTRIIIIILLINLPITLLQGCVPVPPAICGVTPTFTPTTTPTVTPIPVPLLRGLAYSPYRDCQSPDTLDQPTIENIEQDLHIISTMANGIRTYSSTGISAEIPALASQLGLRASAGAWLGKDKAANELEIQALIDIAQSVEIESVIVGNEVLLRGDLTEDELITYIERVKNSVAVPVTTAEIGQMLLDHPKVINAVDYLMVHLYPFWGGVPIDYAAQSVIEEYRNVQKTANGKRVVIGETGWPSGGPPLGAAVPSTENQRRFAQEFLTLAQAQYVEFYYFSAFDEMWKSEGGVGPYWGLLHADRTFKYDIDSVMVSYDVALQPLTEWGTTLQATPQETLQGDTIQDYYIYDRFGDGYNNFSPGGWMGDNTAINLNPCWVEGQIWPSSAIKIIYFPSLGDPNRWAGMYWLRPDGNWGTIPNAGVNLIKYKQLIFEAQAETSGLQVKFFVGGVSESTPGTPVPYPSSVSAPIYAIEADPIDGFVNMTNSWQEYHIDLTSSNLSNVIDGFGWAAEQARSPGGATFYIDNIRFVTTESDLEVIPPLHIYSGEFLREGLNMGIDSSGHRYDWVEDLEGEMKVDYPSGQSWGVVYITVGNSAPRGSRNSMNLTQYHTLSVELRGKSGGESVYIGLKDKYQLDDSSETKLLVHLSAEYQTYTFSLSEFVGTDLKHIYLPIEFVFQKNIGAETIYFRNIQYLP